MSKPRFNIPLETLVQANKCTKKHACLIEENYRLCGVKVNGDNQARMICGKGLECSYNTYLGEDAVCTCPVRQAIYRKYDR